MGDADIAVAFYLDIGRHDGSEPRPTGMLAACRLIG